MTVVTYRQIEPDAVHTVVSEYGNVDVFVIFVLDDVEEEGPGPVTEYMIERQRLIPNEGGGFIMPSDAVHWCNDEDEARTTARRLCMEARSQVPGAFCVLDSQSRYGDDDAVYVSWDQACEDGR